MDTTNTQKQQARSASRVKNMFIPGMSRFNRRPGTHTAAFLLCCGIFLISVILHARKAFVYNTVLPADTKKQTLSVGETLTQTLPSEKRTIRALYVKFGVEELTEDMSSSADDDENGSADGTEGTEGSGGDAMTEGSSFESEIPPSAAALTVSFLKNDKTIKTWEITSADLTDGEYFRFLLNRPVRTDEDDVCSFTVTKETAGSSLISLWTSRGGSFSSTMEDNGSSHRSICWRLTLEDSGMRISVMFPFLAGLILLCLAAAFLLDLERVSIAKMILVTAAVLFLTETVPADLMQKIVRDIPIRQYSWDGKMTSLGPGETLEETLELDKAAFSSITLPIGNDENQSDSLRIRLTRLNQEEGTEDYSSDGSSDEGTVYFDDQIEHIEGGTARTCFVGGGPTGLAARISARDTLDQKYFPRGTYSIAITNLDEEKKLWTSVVETTEAVTAGADSGQTAENDSADSDENEEKDSEDEDSDGLGETAQGDAAAYTQTRETLNYQLLRTSTLGYRLACLVFLILGAYILAMCFLAGSLKAGARFSAERFFITSVIPLALIHLILMLPWSPPDTGSHILAAYRYSNMIVGSRGENEWMGRADDAALFPDEWKIDEISTKFNPNMKQYAEMYLNVRLFVKDRTPTPIGSDEKMKYYSVFNYLPQVAGLTLGRVLRLGTVPILWLARLAILAVWIAACRHAVRIAPVGKILFAAVPLLPISLMIGSSISYDAMVMISTLCFTASVLRLSQVAQTMDAGRGTGFAKTLGDANRVQNYCILECALWAALIGSVKGGGYLILLPLLLLCVTTNLSASLRRVLPVIGAGGVAALLFDVILAPDALFQFGQAGSGRLTASFALAHPMQYLDMLMSTYIENADAIFMGVGGTRLAWMETVIPEMVIACLLFVLIIFASAQKKKELFDFTPRIKRVILIILGVMLFFMPAMLLSWTTPGSEIIMGLQGRYYLPVLPLFLLLAVGSLSGKSLASIPTGSRTDPEDFSGGSPDGAETGARRFIFWFCIISCLCVYYMLRLYLTR